MIMQLVNCLDRAGALKSCAKIFVALAGHDWLRGQVIRIDGGKVTVGVQLTGVTYVF